MQLLPIVRTETKYSRRLEYYYYMYIIINYCIYKYNKLEGYARTLR